jgi:subtilisin-like proprotein convertase family protein
VPKDIQDLQPTTPKNTLGKTTSLLTVPDSNTISDLNIELDITMPGNNADLNVYLKSPDGKEV